LNGFVLHAGTGDNHVEFAIVHDARLDEVLDTALLLENQKGVAFGREVGLGLGFVWPVHDQVTIATEVRDYFVLVNVWREAANEDFAREALLVVVLELAELLLLLQGELKEVGVELLLLVALELVVVVVVGEVLLN